MRKSLTRPCIASVLLVTLSIACSDTEPIAETEETVETPATEIADTASFPDVVAIVNGAEIRKSVLLERAARLQAEAPTEETTSRAFYERMLDELVGAELLYQASRERVGDVDAAAIEQQLATLRQRFPDAAAFEQALAQEGLTLEGLRDEMKRDLGIRKLIETEVIPNVSVSDEDKKNFYAENPEQMRQPDRLRLSHILKRVAPDAPPEVKEATRVLIEDVLAQAREGADFATLAREHSEDPGSAANGGELTVSRGETVPPFEAAAFALEPGGLSPVVETQFGFHIIKLSEKMEGQPIPYEQAEASIEQFLTQQAVQAEVESTVESLKESGTVELFI